MNLELISHVKKGFKLKHITDPLMVFSPGRINIIGEHTDYNEGFVFPAAIDKGIVAAFEKSSSGTSTAYAMDMEETLSFNAARVSPLKEQLWGNYILGVVSEIQKKGILVENFNVVFSGDIPKGSGMSSSAALENAIVFGLNELFKLGLTKQQMIFISQKAEHHFAGVKCGIMDQYASMFGMESNALHLDCRTISAQPYKIEFRDYELLLVNSNVKHSLNDSAYNDRRAVCEYISKLLGVKSLREANEAQLETVKDLVSETEYQKALFVVQENNRTIAAAQAITANDLKQLGALIYASHEGLQHQYQVSCEEMDFLVDFTRNNEAVLGARMMGGGFGGCTINLIKSSEIQQFSTDISKAYKQKYQIDCTLYSVQLSNGTQLINL